MKGMDADTFRLSNLLKGGLANSAGYATAPANTWFTMASGWAGSDYFIKVTLKTA